MEPDGGLSAGDGRQGSIKLARSAARRLHMLRPREEREKTTMVKKTARGRKQDRAWVAGKQDYEVRYEAKKTGKSKAKVKRAVKKAGPSRKRVERALGG